MGEKIINDEVIKAIQKAHNDLMKGKKEESISLREKAKKMDKANGLEYLGVEGRAIELEQHAPIIDAYFKELINKLKQNKNN